MQRVDMAFWLAGDILLKTDKMAMAHSLESRVPFLDKKVFEFASTLPVSQKVSPDQTKIALREAAERAIPARLGPEAQARIPYADRRLAARKASSTSACTTLSRAPRPSSSSM